MKKSVSWHVQVTAVGDFVEDVRPNSFVRVGRENRLVIAEAGDALDADSLPVVDDSFKVLSSNTRQRCITRYKLCIWTLHYIYNQQQVGLASGIGPQINSPKTAALSKYGDQVRRLAERLLSFRAGQSEFEPRTRERWKWIYGEPSDPCKHGVNRC